MTKTKSKRRTWKCRVCGDRIAEYVAVQNNEQCADCYGKHQGIFGGLV